MSHSKKRKEKKDYLFEEILKTFHNAGKPLNHKQIAFRLGLEDKSQRLLISFLLRDLAKKKILKEIGAEKYILTDYRQQMTDKKSKPHFLNSKSEVGKVDMTSSGAAYVIVESREQDIYVAPRNTHNAMDGDKVRVRLLHGKNKKPEGIIEEIIERAKSEFVGTVQLSREFAFLVPDNPKISFDIHIPLDAIKGAKDGQKAVGKILKWEHGRKNPQGEILRVLGDAGRNDTEIHAILEEFGLPYTFPKEITKFTEKIPVEISKEEISRRRDFRNVTTFTIDPFDAKDFDDAISVRKTENGFWEIGVHIADVSHYLKEGTVLDKEAYLRGTSVYLVDRVV